ncbi:CapA family protein [Aerococcaceae bacterium DSM 111022]|nr:CapA family protein [Aerococcaceae bacterium DSM 111022]
MKLMKKTTSTLFCALILMSSFLTINAQDDVQRVTIRSVGDILVHDTVFNDAWNGEAYDFTKQFEAVKPYMENADITTANLEVIAAGELTGPLTYPSFSSPPEIIDALKDAGVDIVTNATNHTLDHGAAGAHESIDQLQARDMMYVGSYESWDDYNDLRIIEKNGLKVGFLSYSYGANGNPIPSDEPYLLTLIDPELIRLETELLASQTDVAVVNVHVGEEYELYPNEYQREIVNIIRDAGANMYLGGHPHVLQPLDYFSPGQGAIYSHGNFLHGQAQLETKISGIFEYTFAKHPGSDDVVLEKMRMMPTYTYGYPEHVEHGVVPLADAGEYGIDSDSIFAELRERLTYYTNHVEIVEYLD